MMRRLIAALGLVAAALAAAAGPLLLSSVLPVSEPAEAYATALDWVNLARVAAGALALCAGALFLMQGYGGSLAARRALVATGVVAALGIIVLASPVVRDAVVADIVDDYTQSGVLASMQGMSPGDPPPAERAFALFAAPESVQANVNEVRLDGVPVRRHDVLRVGVVVRGEAWESEGSPMLAVPGHMICEPAEVEDRRSRSAVDAGAVSYLHWWICAVAKSGESDVIVQFPANVEGRVALFVSVLPTVTMLAPLAAVSGSILVLAVASLSAFLGASFAGRRESRPAPDE